MSKRESELYLQDILDSITKVEEFIKDFTFEQFENDEKTTEAVIRKLEIIGEAAKNLPEEARDKYPNVPWGKMIGMRNKILHEYFGVDTETVWKTITEDLPMLKKSLKF